MFTYSYETDTQSSSPKANTQVPKDLTVDTLAEDEQRLMGVRSYMIDRLGQSGEQRDGEANKDYVERFLTHMRSFENRSLELTDQIDYLRSADEQQRKQFLNAYTIYNTLPGFLSEGGGDTMSALGDYAYYNVVDPINLIGLGVGSIAAKTAAKEGVKGIIKGLARNPKFLSFGATGASEALVGAGMDAGLQNIEKEAGVRDEFDFGRMGTMAGLSGAGAMGVQALGVGAKKLVGERSLKGEVAEAKGATPEAVQQVTENTNKQMSELMEFDGTRGREILDRIGDVKQGDLLEPEVRVEVNKAIADVAEDLFSEVGEDGATLSGVGRVGEGEKVSDALFRVLQDSDVIKNIDEVTLAGAIQKAGLTPEQFAQIYRTTISDSARQLNALSQLSKKLRGLSPDKEANKRIRDYFDLGEEGKSVRAWLQDIDRNRRGLLVSQVPTLIRNMSTTGVRGFIETGAGIVDSFAFYGMRKYQKAKGMDVPEYSLNQALSDSVGFMRNAVDQGWSEEVVKATLANNPKLLNQISRNVTDIGAGTLTPGVQAMNFLNMAHDGFVRRAVYAASVEKQLNRITGKTLAETMATDGVIPKQIQQRAVREALEFTFADMPTGPVLGGFVKIVEGLPFIGTSVFTFPRFTAAAFQFSIDYVLPGKAIKGAIKIGKYARSADKVKAQKLLNDGTTELSQATMGMYLLGEAIAHRLQNQDLNWYEYRDDQGRTGDLRPFFPAAPYLAVADGLVKLYNGQLDRYDKTAIPEALIGTNLAGSQAYIFNNLVSSWNSESKGGIDAVGGQKAAELLGGFVGELAGGPVNVNLVTGLIRDVERTFLTDAALMRETRISEENSAFGRFQEGFSNAFTRTTPYVLKNEEGQELPALQSPTRDADMYYQSPLATTFTGVRKNARRNPLETELIRLGIKNFEIAPSTGDRKIDMYRNEALGRIAENSIDVTSESYQRMSDAKKRNFLIERFQSLREPTAAISQARSSSDRKTVEGRSYTPFDKMQWSKLPKRIRDEVNEEYVTKYGKSVEQLGAYRQGTEQGSALRGRFN